MNLFRTKLYENYRSTAQKGTIDRLYFQRLKYAVARILPESKDVLMIDIGAGSGDNIAAVRNLGYKNIKGVDISPEQVQAAADAGIDGVSCADAFEWLEHNKNKYAVIFALDLIEHFSKQEIIKFIELSFDALEPKGVIIVRVPNSLVIAGYRYCDFTHQQAFTSHSIAQALRVGGFTDVEIRECAPEPVSVLGVIRLGLWKLVRLAIYLYFYVATGNAMGGVYSMNLIAVARKNEAGKDLVNGSRDE